MRPSPRFGFNDEGKLVPKNDVAKERFGENYNTTEDSKADILFEKFDTGFRPLAQMADLFHKGLNKISQRNRLITLSAMTGLSALLYTVKNSTQEAEAAYENKSYLVEIVADPGPIIDPQSDTNYFEPVSVNVEYNRGRNLERARELGIPATYELLADSPNAELINQLSTYVLDLPPGDYDGQLEPEHKEDVVEASKRAHLRHKLGIDKRSILEQAIIYQFVDYDNDIRRTDNEGRLVSTINEHHAHNRTVNERFENIISSSLGEPTIGDYLRLAQVMTSIHAREIILAKLFYLIQSGSGQEYGLRPLTADELDWCKDTEVYDGPSEIHISKESLIWAVNTDRLMRLAVATSPDSYLIRSIRSGTVKDDLQAIINGQVPTPGAIAMLQHTETKGLKYIGDAPFVSQLNQEKDRFPTSKHGLRRALQDVERYYGIPFSLEFKNSRGEARYAWEYVAGSLRLNEASGGANYAQHMGNMTELNNYYWNRARLDMYQKLGVLTAPRLPGSPFFMMLDTGLWLTGNNPNIQGHPDYINRAAWADNSAKGGWYNDPLRSVKSWNPKDYQAKYTTLADVTYSGEIPNTNYELAVNDFSADFIRDTLITSDGREIEYLKYQDQIDIE